jgi:hypothetical protein
MSNHIMFQSKPKKYAIDARGKNIIKLGFEGIWGITYYFLINSSSLFDI